MKAKRPQSASDPDPKVSARVVRRYPADYKLRILEEAEECSKPGEVTALLRREGLHSSHLTRWRQRLEAGGVEALTDGALKPPRRDPLAQRVRELKRQNARLRDQLEKAKAVMEVQHSLLLTSFEK